MTNRDITYVSNHILGNLPFSEEKVTNYIGYGENRTKQEKTCAKEEELVENYE